MLAFPNCKINLGLNIIRKRSDGYHDLETVFYPIPLTDALEIIPASTFSFNVTGIPVHGSSIGDNLCVKAYNLLKRDFPDLPSIDAHLHKVIPMGAGLGGGSANGAFMLLMLNTLLELGLSQDQLETYALQLGSDCPFFIKNTPCFATGRGEELQEVPVDLSMYNIAIVNPIIHVSTREAFEKLIPAMPEKRISQIIAQPVATWKDELVNDFEKPVCRLHPEIAGIKQRLYEAGAIYASMTGSGSTVFGLFDKSLNIHLSFPVDYLYKLI